MKRFAAGAALGGAAILVAQWIKDRLTGDGFTKIVNQSKATRPHPSGEMILQVNQSARIIAIYTSTKDASSWIDDQAPIYGNLFPPEDEHAPYILLVSAFHDPMTVGKFLYSGYHQGVIDDDSNDSNIFAA